MSKISNAYLKSLKGMKWLFRETPAEIAVVGLLSAAMMTGLGQRWEYNRDKIFKLGFSEISQIKDNAAAQEKEVDSFTLYHAGLNDTIMKVLETWNHSFAFSKSAGEAYENFATRLHNRMSSHEYTYGFKTITPRHNLADFLETVPLDAQAALKELAPFSQVANGIRGVNGNFARSWDEKHDDNYHSEMRTRQVSHTDSKGNTTYSTETYWVDVYDDTDHYFTYHKKAGEAASQSLDALVAQFKDLSININMMMAAKVGEENRDAIMESREKEKDIEEMTEADIVRIANTWRFGSNLHRNRGTFRDPLATMKKDAPKWRAAKATAKTVHYNTTSRSHSGPREFQLAESALAHGQSLEKSLRDAIQPIQYAQGRIPGLKAKIDKYVDDVLYGRVEDKGEIKKQAYEIRDTVIDLYEKSFHGGFTMEKYRGWMVAIYGVLGLLVGGAAGFGLDRLGNNFNWYKEKRKSRNSDRDEWLRGRQETYSWDRPKKSRFSSMIHTTTMKDEPKQEEPEQKYEEPKSDYKPTWRDRIVDQINKGIYKLETMTNKDNKNEYQGKDRPPRDKI